MGIYSEAMRKGFPKRLSELVALVSVSTTVFLFIHTQMLTARIDEIQSGLDKNSSEKSVGWERRLDPLGAEVSSSELNNTQKAEKDTLFFNRVPKVGSQTIMNLIQRLANLNSFTFHKDGTQKVETIKMTYYEESRLTTMIDMFSPPAAYVKHVVYSNFSRHGYGTPIYVNLVRDPIERAISWFYYIRAPWYIVERRQAFPELPLPHPKWLKKDFESCVLQGDRECQFIPGEVHDGVGDHRRQAMFFCGHHERCVEFNGLWAMNEAKRNVEENYAVVGVLEDLDVTLQVLERYVPRFFQGAYTLYQNGTQKKINRNIYKPPVSEQVKSMLRNNFTREIEFYEFCRQRLHKMFHAV